MENLIDFDSSKWSDIIASQDGIINSLVNEIKRTNWLDTALYASEILSTVFTFTTKKEALVKKTNLME